MFQFHNATIKLNHYGKLISTCNSPTTIFIQPIGPFPFPETDLQKLLIFLQRFLLTFYNTKIIVKEVHNVNDLSHLDGQPINSRTHKMLPPDTIQFSIPDLIRFYSPKFNKLKNKEFKGGFSLVLLTGFNIYSSTKGAISILGQTYPLESIAVCSIGQYLNSINFSEKSIDYYLPVLRVMSHEIAHLYGLPHCQVQDVDDKICGMQYSKSGDHAMLQPLEFCDKCLKRLKATTTHWIGKGEMDGLTKRYLKKTRNIELVKLLGELGKEIGQNQIFDSAIKHYKSKLDRDYAKCDVCKHSFSNCVCV